jgi:hypothetical protein
LRGDCKLDKQEIIRIIKEEIEKISEKGSLKSVHQSQLTPRIIKRQHIFDKVIVFGSGDRPSSDATGVSVHFDTGTGVLSCWNGSTWLETTLS